MEASLTFIYGVARALLESGMMLTHFSEGSKLKRALEVQDLILKHHCEELAGRHGKTLKQLIDDANRTKARSARSGIPRTHAPRA